MMADYTVQDKLENAREKTMKKHGKRDDSWKEKISKKLCYILRYGAIKEGLQVHEGDFVNFKELMALPMMQKHQEQDVMEIIVESKNWKGFRRFMAKKDHEKTMVRALSPKCFERSPYHPGTKVPRLLEVCTQFVLTHLQEYDLEDFPDEFLISSMIHQLRRAKKLNKANLEVLLVPVLERLSLEGVFVTEAMLRLVWTKCPNLRQLSLKDCGYIITDALVQRLLKKLPKLESLTLSGCSHLTDVCLQHLAKEGRCLQHLNLSNIHSFSEEAVLQMVQELPCLTKLDIFEVNMSVEARIVLRVLAKEKGMVFYLKRLKRKNLPKELEEGEEEQREEGEEHWMESYVL